MQSFKSAFAMIAAASLFMSSGASAGAANVDEQIRKLDIMLMVTSLRCRFGAENFQPQYQNFSANNLSTLNGAARRLEGDLTRKHGAKGAKRQLDRISVSMANEYGQGHPWLGCAELKQIATQLSGTRDPVALALAADELLGPKPQSGGRFARR